MSDIVHLGAHRAADDNTLWTPAEMLRATADEDCEGITRALVILLDDREPGDYTSGFRLSNLSYSQAVTLLEVVKAQMVARLSGAGNG